MVPALGRQISGKGEGERKDDTLKKEGD